MATSAYFDFGHRSLLRNRPLVPISGNCSKLLAAFSGVLDTSLSASRVQATLGHAEVASPLALLTLALSLTELHGQTTAPSPVPGKPQAAGIAAAAQNTRESSPDSTTLSSSTTIVLVPALVTNKQGEPIYTLTAQDFTVTDDGIPQKLTLEENSDSEPLAMVVAIQTGGAAANRLDRYQRLAPLIEAMVGNVPHKIAVVTFGSAAKLVLNFTPGFTPNESTSSAALAESIHDLKPDDQGAAILDTLSYAVDLLRSQPPQYRRAILLISETQDQGRRDEA